MTYLVDSDWIADWLSGTKHATQLLSTLGRQGLAISLITYGEIYEGIYFGKDPARARQVFRRLLQGMTVLPLNRRIMQRFAHIRGDLRRQGQLIPDPDLLIAATALHHDLILVTRNTRHFQRIPALSLYNP
jgi:tRNA(fMet)-specific endonuclease VapC